jgi:hypothetical protein
MISDLEMPFEGVAVQPIRQNAAKIYERYEAAL